MGLLPHRRHMHSSPFAIHAIGPTTSLPPIPPPGGLESDHPPSLSWAISFPPPLEIPLNVSRVCLMEV